MSEGEEEQQQQALSLSAEVGDEFEAEQAVGMTEFVRADWKGFGGILKHRLCDFKVYEMDLEGQVVRLTDTLVDPALVIKADANDAEAIGMDALKETLSDSLEEAFLAQLLVFYEDTAAETILTPELPSKEVRTVVHRAVRSLFKGTLQSETQGDCIRIYRPNLGAKRRRDRNSQPADQQRYLSFTLCKTNMDTIEAVQLLARRLHMTTKDFSYAGTKDRRGITTQKMVARSVTPAKVLGINKLFEDDRLRVSNVQLAREPLSLGDLQGNRFELVIRNIEGAADDGIARAIDAFGTDGFINYFGLQRFGTSSVPSHSIGTALLRGNWQAAIDLILDPRDGEGDERCSAARQHYKTTGNAAEAKELFPARYTAERQVLAQLGRAPNDLIGAVLAVNRELRMMYVHSVQSLIWNRMASARHRLHGRNLVPGDFVQADGSDEIVEMKDSNIGDYSADQLVLPIPGYETRTPANLAELYAAELDKLQVPSLEEAFRPKSKALWDLPGTYRRVYITPRDVEYRLGQYADPDADIETLLPSTDPVEGHRGLWIAFSLPSSCYATMALRELMHSTTDPRKHKIRTKAHISRAE